MAPGGSGSVDEGRETGRLAARPRITTNYDRLLAPEALALRRQRERSINLLGQSLDLDRFGQDGRDPQRFGDLG